MPIFFWSDKTTVFGVIHSGWKGTRDCITEKTIEHLHEEYPGINLHFLLGPCIRGNEYEVKEDVSQFFRVDPDSVNERNGKIYLGLERALQNRIKKKGYQLLDSEISNYSNPGYFSHRRGDTGRNLNSIRIIP
jgi:copper oxidase (laccase) domain-containing protein